MHKRHFVKVTGPGTTGVYGSDTIEVNPFRRLYEVMPSGALVVYALDGKDRLYGPAAWYTATRFETAPDDNEEEA